MIERSSRLIAVLVVASTAAALAATPGYASWKEVAVSVSLPSKLETEPDTPLLVARVRSNDHEFIDVGLEVSRWLRRELARETALATLDVPFPPIPEQRPEQLAANDRFWRRLGDDFGADLIVAGIAEFIIEDRSGFITEDVISPTTRQTVRRSRYAELRGFKLELEVFVFQGDNGALLHHDVWKKESIVDSEQLADDLTLLYALLETMKDDLLAIFLPTRLLQPRYIWVE